MEGRRFDALARAAAVRTGRRRAVLGALGLAAVAVPVVRASAQRNDPRPNCANEGEPCTLWAGCCDDLTCVAQLVNPNDGVCEAGIGVRGEAGAVGTPRSGLGAALNDLFGKTTRSEVGVRVACDGRRDLVTVENRGESTIVVRFVAVEYRAGSGSGNRPGPYAINERVAPGKTVALRFGARRGAADRELLREGEKGVVEVRTSVGTFRDECSDGSAASVGSAGTPTGT